MKRIFLTLAVVSLFSVNAFALETYSFNAVTSNGSYYNSPDVKLFVDVASYSTTQVSFDFRNDSLVSSAVKTIAIEEDIYLTDIASIDNHTGVSFTSPANPPNFPGPLNFDESFVLSANADAPSGLNGNGIDKGEHLLVIANLTGGKTYADVINGLDSGEFRIGIHAGSFPDGSSEKYINGGHPPVVPAPGALILASIGVSVVGWIRRKQVI